MMLWLNITYHMQLVYPKSIHVLICEISSRRRLLKIPQRFTYMFENKVEKLRRVNSCNHLSIETYADYTEDQIFSYWTSIGGNLLTCKSEKQLIVAQ